MWEDDGPDCGWAVDDETDGDDDDNSTDIVCMVEANARYLPQSAGESDGESSESEVEGAENMSAKSEFDDEEENLATAAEVECANIPQPAVSATGPANVGSECQVV